jgi:hypothetical protein
VGQLADAVKAYHASETALRRTQEAAAARVRAARDDRTRARERLAQAIVAEARAGTSQVEIIRATGYSRERIRQILRAAGVEADT